MTNRFARFFFSLISIMLCSLMFGYATQATAAQKKEVAAEAKKAAEKAGSATDKEAILVLAKKSGCMACHATDKKLVGPSWADVAARYKGDAKAKTMLIEKVKKGGKGNWTKITGGVPMPPNSPKVSDADIEKLVNFVLSTAK